MIIINSARLNCNLITTRRRTKTNKNSRLDFYEAFSSEVTESEVAEDDLRGVEYVEGAAVLAAKEEGLGLHVDVGGVAGGGGDLVGEEYGGGVEVLA